VFVPVVAFAAAGTSLACVRGALHGQVYATDSAVYLFEARALSHGLLGAVIPGPRLAFGGRFLFEGADGHLHGVFPPGYPLYLVPFVAMRAPLLAGPVTAALLVFAQFALARNVTRDRSALYVSLLLSIPSSARILETGDLLSHAFVAVLATTGLALALDGSPRFTTLRSVALGVACGWAFAARMLDGLVIAAVVVPFALGRAHRGRRLVRSSAWILAGALPFAMLVLADQHAATGSWLTPTQAEYFDRSDSPLHCHRLGFGREVGCEVEHPGSRATFGANGYTPRAALDVSRTRAIQLGRDLFGPTSCVLVALAAAAIEVDVAALLLVLFTVALAFAYGLFYFGNDVFFGARHLFPAAPAVWILMARGISVLPGRASGFGDRSHTRAILAFALLAAVYVDQTIRGSLVFSGVGVWQSRRLDLDAALQRAHVSRGLAITRDAMARTASFDPGRDGRGLIVVEDDRSGLLDLRRTHPTLPVVVVTPSGDVGVPVLPPPPPGLLVELERAWPSYQRVDGLAATSIHAPTALSMPSSGENVLYVFHAREGGTLTIPFDVAQSGRFVLRLSGLLAPNLGDYAIRVDDVALPTWHGFARRPVMFRGVSSDPVFLAAGRHVFRATCLGHAPLANDNLAVFDSLAGEPAP
jgi:hypothetical protein